MFTLRSLFAQQSFREGQILRTVSTQLMSVYQLPLFYTLRSSE